ncbi:MAG: hypothetical protein LC798_12215 [Chloroflexi bacterium]|nr:hypothetical protein [Chloroflexota bacterium]
MSTPLLPSIDQAAPALAGAAARALGISTERVFARDKHARVVLARQLAMAAARRHGYTLPEIGEAFDRNHSTVLYAQRTIAARVSEDPRVATLFEGIAGALPAPAHPTMAPAALPMPLTALVASTQDGRQLVRGDDIRRLAALVLLDRGLADLLARLTSGVVDGAAGVLATALARTTTQAPPPVLTADHPHEVTVEYFAGDSSAQAALPSPPSPPAAAALRRRPRPRRAHRATGEKARPAARRALLCEVVGRYRTTGGESRQVILTLRDGDRVLLDRVANAASDGDERVIERFGSTAGLLQVAAVADGYLDEARRLGRPVVASEITASGVAR